METTIIEHLDAYVLDIRSTKDARFMDQKVTPDVLSIVADCVLQFIKDDSNKEFSAKDIWKHQYTQDNVKEIFNKPDVLKKSSANEYNKFFSQPLRMLAYSHILDLDKRRGRNIYRVKNEQLLKYISIKERNALNFLVVYLEQVLKKSDIFDRFQVFFDNNSKEKFDELKSNYEEFIIKYTSIKKKLEVRRIFTKILNPLSYVRKLHGTKWWLYSQDVIGYDELMYNRKNWRDIKKLKGETRKEYETRVKCIINHQQTSFAKFTMVKAKRLIREKYLDKSEVQDECSNGQATQVHHIFPKSEYPRISSYLENLILLTATQHSTKAHPDNNTKLINKEFQYLCLLSKCDSIKKSVEDDDWFYSKDDFVFVLNEWIQPKKLFTIQQTFEDIIKELAFEYNRI